MAKSSGGSKGGSSGGSIPPYKGSTSDAFYKKVSRAYKAEYYINKGRSSLSDAEIDRAVSLGILRDAGNNEYLMRS